MYRISHCAAIVPYRSHLQRPRTAQFNQCIHKFPKWQLEIGFSQHSTPRIPTIALLINCIFSSSPIALFLNGQALTIADLTLLSHLLGASRVSSCRLYSYMDVYKVI